MGLKGKAAILETLNMPLVIDEVETPDLGCGQVLVEVHRSGICGAQLNEIAGIKGEDKYLPHLLGHEGGGIVRDIGPGVTQVRSDDHVVMHWRKGAGIESAPPKYRCGSRFVGGGWVTTFNEYAVVSENRLTPIPEDVPFDLAALMGCAITTAFGLINNEAQVKLGESVAVFGVGGVGLNVVAGAALVSACPIIGIDIYDQKLQMAAALGASHAINGNVHDIRDEIFKIVGSRGVDVTVECTGRVELMQLAYEVTAQSGRTILVGQPRHDQALLIPQMARHFGGKILMTSQGGQTDPTRDIPRYVQLYRRGKLKLDSIITHRFGLVDVNAAIDSARAGEAGRCMLELA